MRDKKVIIVEGANGKWYEQAIFIVKPGFEAPKDLVAEAEKIIGEYIGRQRPAITAKNTAAGEIAATREFTREEARELLSPPRKSSRKAGKTLDFVLNTIMIFCVVVLSVLLAYAFWG